MLFPLSFITNTLPFLIFLPKIPKNTLPFVSLSMDLSQWKNAFLTLLFYYQQNFLKMEVGEEVLTSNSEISSVNFDLYVILYLHLLWKRNLPCLKMVSYYAVFLDAVTIDIWVASPFPLCFKFELWCGICRIVFFFPSLCDCTCLSLWYEKRVRVRVKKFTSLWEREIVYAWWICARSWMLVLRWIKKKPIRYLNIFPKAKAPGCLGSMVFLILMHMKIRTL